MMQFSDSYHLFTTDVQEVRLLLRKACRYSMILSGNGKFIPFIVEPDHRSSDPIVKVNGGILIHYDFSDINGVFITVYNGAEEVGSLNAGPHIVPQNPKAFVTLLEKLGVIESQEGLQILDLVSKIPVSGIGDNLKTLNGLTSKLVEFIGIQQLEFLTGYDLWWSGNKKLKRRFPDATFINHKHKGKIRSLRQPNQWCSEEGMPYFMYWPLPDTPGLTDRQAATVEKHLEYWLETGDWDDKKGEGFWLYCKYKDLLPSRYKHLPERMKNLFDNESLRETIRAVIAIVEEDVDWDAVLSQPSPAPVRLSF